MHSTYFGLLAEFGAAELPLEPVAKKYFGLDAPRAKRDALLARLPVPAYRAADSQKSPWLISAADLAVYIDAKRAEARDDWARVRSA